MSDSLIEQVRKMIEAQGKSVFAEVAAIDGIDFKRLLAHMQAQQAVVDAARSVLTALGVDDVPYTGIKRALAALEKVKP